MTLPSDIAEDKRRLGPIYIGTSRTADPNGTPTCKATHDSSKTRHLGRDLMSRRFGNHGKPYNIADSCPDCQLLAATRRPAEPTKSAKILRHKTTVSQPPEKRPLPNTRKTKTTITFLPTTFYTKPTKWTHPITYRNATPSKADSPGRNGRQQLVCSAQKNSQKELFFI